MFILIPDLKINLCKRDHKLENGNCSISDLFIELTFNIADGTIQ
jgi:hypothetical protein